MDLLNICRLCMAEKFEYYNIFDLSENLNFSFNELVLQIAPVSIETDDLLSKNICSSCRDSCNEFVRFRDLIQSSNDYQLQMLGKEEPVDEMDIVEEKILGTEKHVEVFEVNDDNFIYSDASDEYSESGLSDDGDFSCEKCHKRFDEETKLEEHIKTHTSRPRLHQCKTCKRKFSNEKLLQRHEIIHSDLITQIKPEVKDRCIVCLQTDFKDKLELEDHMRAHKEAAETGTVACQYCDKVYNNLTNLVRHLKTHDENKTHLCTICNKVFAMGQELVDHLNQHNGFVPHTCHLCNKSYMQLSKLKNHLRSHSNVKVSKILVIPVHDNNFNCRNSFALNAVKASIATQTCDNIFFDMLVRRSFHARFVLPSLSRKEISKHTCRHTPTRSHLIATFVDLRSLNLTRWSNITEFTQESVRFSASFANKDFTQVII